MGDVFVFRDLTNSLFTQMFLHDMFLPLGTSLAGDSNDFLHQHCYSSNNTLAYKRNELKHSIQGLFGTIGTLKTTSPTF